MSIQRGEDVMFGVGLEDTRGVGVVPQAWIPGRTPSGIAPVIDKVNIRETRGSKFASHSSESVMKRVEGDLEFNLRAISFGYLLKSLLGDVSSAAVMGQSGVYDHTFSVLPNNPEHPTLTIGLNQPAGQSYRFLKAMCSMIGIELVPNDLVKATASFIAATEEDVVDYNDTDPITGDHYFRHQDATIKFAANVAGLAGASAIKVKSLKVDVPNGARPDQNVSELNPGNILATTFEPKISAELDYQNEDFHDAFDGDEYFAMQLTLERSDIVIGSSAHPRISFVFPRVSIEKWTPNRPIDDIMREAVDFVVHYSETEEYGIRPVLRNTLAEYDAVSS